MKKLKLFILPIMVTPLLANCSSGGGNPDPTTTFSVALLAEEGKFSDGSVTRFIKDVPAGTKLNQTTGYEAPVIENLDYTFGDWLNPNGDTVPVDVTIDSDIVLKASYILSAEYYRKVYLAKLEEDSKYANLAIPTDGGGNKYPRVVGAIGDIKKPDINGIYQYAYHTIALDDKRTAKAISSGQIKAIYTYVKKIVESILLKKDRVEDFSSEILLQHYINQINTITAASISTLAQEEAIDKLCDVIGRQLFYGAVNYPNNLKYLDLSFSKYVGLITGNDDTKTIENITDIALGVLSSTIFISSDSEYSELNSFVEKKVEELTSQATSKEDYDYLLHLASGYLASYIKSHDDKDTNTQINEYLATALKDHFNEDYVLKRTGDFISEFLYAYGTNNIAHIYWINSVIESFQQYAKPYDKQNVDKIYYFASTYAEGFKNYTAELFNSNKFSFYMYDTALVDNVTHFMQHCEFKEGKANPYLTKYYDILVSICNFQSHFIERMYGYFLNDMFDDYNSVETVSINTLTGREIFPALEKAQFEGDRLAGFCALISSLYESSACSGGNDTRDGTDNVINAYTTLCNDLSSFLSPTNAICIGKICAAIETGRCHQRYGEDIKYFNNEIKYIKSILPSIFGCNDSSRIEPLIETIVEIYKVAYVVRPVFSLKLGKYDDGLNQASDFVHSIISSKVLPIINKWIGSNDVFMMQLDMIKKTVTNINFYFLKYKGSQILRMDENEVAFTNFLDVYFDSLFSDKYFGESHFDKIGVLTQTYYNDFLYPELYCHDESEEFKWEIAANKAIEDMDKIVSGEN